MFIFISKDGDFKVALENLCVVVFKNIKTGEQKDSVKNIEELLDCSYSYGIQDKIHEVPESSPRIGGRRWCSLKYAIKDYIKNQKRIESMVDVIFREERKTKEEAAFIIQMEKILKETPVKGVKIEYIHTDDSSLNKTTEPKNDFEALESYYRNIRHVTEVAAYRAVGSPRQIELNVEYKTVSGTIIFVKYNNEGNPYQTAETKEGLNVYSRPDDLGSDNGRPTGSKYGSASNLTIVNGSFVKV